MQMRIDGLGGREVEETTSISHRGEDGIHLSRELIFSLEYCKSRNLESG